MARGEPIWQTSSTGPDVDAELQRGGGHQGPQVAGPEPLLHDASAGRRQAAVVGGHLQGGVDGVAVAVSASAWAPAVAAGVGTEAQGQLVGHPLGHLAGVDEDERGAVLEDVAGDPVEDVGELAAAGHRLELGVGELDGHVEVPAVAAVDDGGRAAGRVDAREQTGHHLERALGGREPDALEPAPPRTTRWSSRSRDRARWAPRLSRARVCTSSTITVCTPPRTAREDGAVSSR